MDVCPPDFHGHNRAPVRVRIHIRSHLTTSSTASESAPGSRSPDKARSLEVTQTTLDVKAMRYSGTAGLFVVLLRWITIVSLSRVRRRGLELGYFYIHIIMSRRSLH